MKGSAAPARAASRRKVRSRHWNEAGSPSGLSSQVALAVPHVEVVETPVDEHEQRKRLRIVKGDPNYETLYTAVLDRGAALAPKDDVK